MAVVMPKMIFMKVRIIFASLMLIVAAIAYEKSGENNAIVLESRACTTPKWQDTSENSHPVLLKKSRASYGHM